MISTSPLVGKWVLVVEDEMLVAVLIEDLLGDLGCEVVGPFSNLADALEAAASGQLDLAVLDVNLAGERVYPVAELLERRGIPFLLLSGYGDRAIPSGHPGWRVCAKPFRIPELSMALMERLHAEPLRP